MTVNLPIDAPMESNEAFINTSLIGDDILTFIRDNSLGKELTIPYGNYKAVAFDLKRLYEYAVSYTHLDVYKRQHQHRKERQVRLAVQWNCPS